MENHKKIISAAHGIIEYVENVEEDVILNTLPLSFDYGLYQVIMTFMFGGTLVLEPSFIFLAEVLNKLAAEKVTGFPIVPTILAMLLNSVELKNYDFSKLRYITNTGAALPVEHIRKLREALPHVKIYSMFGLTECKRVSYLPPHEIDRIPESVGKAMPNCEVFVVDKDGKEVEPGVTGELVVRGSNVMLGYWGDPELSKKVYKPGLGFRENLLFTGDYFKKDRDGFLYFVGRKDDMIKTRGERISEREIENILYRLEGVEECAVIGVPDEILGQAIKAFIVPVKKVSLTITDIEAFCSKNM